MHIAKPIQSMVVIAAAALLLTTLPARGAVINEIEPNNSLGTAQNIDAFFTLDFSANIGNEMGNNTSETIPHVTILGTGNGTFDYFSFTVAVASLAIFDIDFGHNSGGSIDTRIAVWDSAGNDLAENDDSSITAGAGGSVSTFDSFIQMNLMPGSYVVGVAEFSSEAGFGGWVGDSFPPAAGATYTLQVSISDGDVPEPATLALLGLGLLGIGLSRRKM